MINNHVRISFYIKSRSLYRTILRCFSNWQKIASKMSTVPRFGLRPQENTKRQIFLNTLSCLVLFPSCTMTNSPACEIPDDPCDFAAVRLIILCLSLLHPISLSVKMFPSNVEFNYDFERFFLAKSVNKKKQKKTSRSRAISPENRKTSSQGERG